MRSFISALQSVFAAFFGVQSEQKRQADFKEHSPLAIIVIAVILFIIFIAAIYFAVSLVLNT
ncbi:DUF2970 domain-containing protein [Pseudoalteromonas sp. APAL1]|uniref:DUF2970 domain-containing protein n=1 Tax=Pseudoalteromonas TaxID=53246 RepID=UPI000EC95D7F|nr:MULTISPECIES: DUF2970 domain-containing protein [unclassified Pseudoalteromonas]MCF2920719.1 DUF2970 domain-containing protein [Pseudoalteromonas sp. APAL1]HCV03256.1 DUF2970 domain-containing protein [Pseudoalteromonas sp.]